MPVAATGLLSLYVSNYLAIFKHLPKEFDDRNSLAID